MVQFHVYPGGKKRIVTFSYDDGPEQDVRLVELFNRYGVKSSFHLNGKNYKNITEEKKQQLRALYEGHEISCHTVNHGWPERMPTQSLVYETIKDREILEDIAGYPVTGMSYPCGGFSADAAAVIATCGIVYSRTTRATKAFYLPENFLTWHPTCHHRDALPLCDVFLRDIHSEWVHPLFYIWGHSFEFRTEEDWQYMEEILKKLSGNDLIWYATNKEIYEYVTAQRQLEISTDERIFRNPTALDVWVEIDKEKILCIPAGQTVRI